MSSVVAGGAGFLRFSMISLQIITVPSTSTSRRNQHAIKIIIAVSSGPAPGRRAAQSRRPSHRIPLLSVARREVRLCGSVWRGANGSRSMTRSSTTMQRMIADARSGASGASWSQRAPSGGGDAHGTSSSSCEAGAPSHWLNRWRTMTRTCRLTWHGSSNTAAPRTRRSGATGLISDGSCQCWASLRNGMPPDSGAHSNDEARRRRARHRCSSR